MKLHRNSQKRYYINNAVYFITTTTYDRYPYFEINELCELFIHDLSICQKLKRFEILGYKINPEHIHLLIQPCKQFNYSDIMNSIKKNVTRDINYVLDFENDYSLKARFANLAFGNGNEIGYENKNVHDNINFANHIRIIETLKSKFIHKYNKNHNIPKFQWQSSFYDHIIRNEFDYHNHLQYIENQWIKHDLKENKWCYIIGK